MSDVAADVAAVAAFFATDTTDVLAADTTDVLSAAKAVSSGSCPALQESRAGICPFKCRCQKTLMFLRFVQVFTGFLYAGSPPAARPKTPGRATRPWQQIYTTRILRWSLLGKLGPQHPKG